jgi:NAD(P) transhydrogenase subunit alpha
MCGYSVGAWLALWATVEGSPATEAVRTPLVVNLAIFILACFVGYEVITKIPPLLHTPLMSGSNAISGITLVGSLVAAGSGFTALWSADAAISVLGFLAVVFATINVVGGFLVTDRMLGMFKRKE